MDLVGHSKKTKHEAGKLLRWGNVLKVLSKYGKIIATGKLSLRSDV